MNFQVAAIVAASTGVLSFLFGLIGGVPFFDIALRAVFWGAVGFGGSLGVETLLRKLVPEVFETGPSPVPEEAGAERAVDIVLEEEAPAPSGFVEEAEDEEPVRRAPARSASTEEPDAASAGGAEEAEEVGPPAAAPGAEGEEMPEIGAFLDAFKPNATGEEEPPAASSPDYGDYAPAPSAPEPYGPQEAFMDGEPQDPAVLAKAVQTILKRDSQGN